MQRLFIKNRKGQRLSMLIEGEDTKGPLAPRKRSDFSGLVFVMHGLGGCKEQPLIKTFADTFLKNGFTVVRFDTTNTFGESDGKYEDATITSYYEDLEDVILWAKEQSWYQEPFWIAGHSLGGICTALYAERHPEKVAGLAPISTVVSGTLSMESHDAEMEAWKRSGWRSKPSGSIPNLIKNLKWTHMEDRMKYDLLPEAKKLTMPALLIVGEYDDDTPPEHQKLLFDAVLGPKELHIIKGAKHTFIEPKHLGEIKELFNRWIKNYARRK